MTCHIVMGADTCTAAAAGLSVMAKRMICGKCSTEQPFSSEKECVKCGFHMGQGARQARHVAKKKADDKFKGANKTVAKKRTGPKASGGGGKKKA